MAATTLKTKPKASAVPKKAASSRGRTGELEPATSGPETRLPKRRSSSPNARNAAEVVRAESPSRTPQERSGASEGKAKRTRKPRADVATSQELSPDLRRADEVPQVDDLATGSSAPLVEPPRSLEKALGAQVRKLRRERDLSMVDLATAAGLSVGMMSKIENGQISPSLSTINALANALHTPFTSLFTAFEEKRDCSYVPAGMGNRIERRGTKAGHVYQLLGKVLDNDVTVEPYLITLEEKAVPYAGFRHAGIELIYMLTGEVVYRHGDECYRLRPGDTLLFDSGAMHGPERLIEVPMTYLSIIVYPRLQNS